MKHVIPLLVAVFTITGSAYGQQVKTANAVTPEIIVTGTRIPQPNLTSVSPITSVSDEAIKLQGANNAIDILNSLPLQFQNSQVDIGAQQNPLSSAGGIATADLRGLGPTRTLVLVNGRRLGVGDASTLNTNPAPDLNQIPTQLIDRVEVVTGGASAVYGSDAVAGVVNFVLKRNFEGLEVDYQHGFAQHTNDNARWADTLSTAGFAQPKEDILDARNDALSVVMGANMDGGRANATVYFSWRQADPVYQGSRDWAACRRSTSLSCIGTPNSNELYVATGPNTLVGPCAVSTDFGCAVQGNQFIPWVDDPANVLLSPPAIFNSQAYQQLSAGDTRFMAGLLAHDQINDRIDAYFEFGFMNDRARSQIAPSGLFQGDAATATTGFAVNCDNPFLSTQQHDIIGCSPGGTENIELIWGRRNIEGGGRFSEYEHNNYRAVFGVKGDLWQGWNYDLYYQYYYTNLFQNNGGYLIKSKIYNALQVVLDGNGNPVCKVGGSCAPYNIFRDGGLQTDPLLGVTQAALDYMTGLGTEYGTNQLKTLHFDIGNDLGRYGLQSPFAQRGIAINVGIENRFERAHFQPDQAAIDNDLAGFGGAGTIVNNSINVLEENIELLVPIAEDKPVARELNFLAGYRHSDYSQAGSASTYKVGFEWRPADVLRFRTMWNRAIRAPNIIELFNPAAVTNSNTFDTDLCAGPTPARSLADCQRTGVTAAQYGAIPQCPAGQCSVLLGGNVALKPETADTFSAGVTITPSFLENLSLSIDYFNISIADEISNVAPEITFASCIDTGQLCGNVHRNPVSGILFGTQGAGYVDGTNQNIAKATTTGVDIQLDYRYDLPGGWGSLSATMVGTWLDTATTRQLVTFPSYDCAGLFGPTCQTVNPTWAHNVRLNWQTPWNVLLSLRWRYFGEVKLEGNSNEPIVGGSPDPASKLAATHYIDASGTWSVGHGIELRGGVGNLFDSNPPIVASAYAQTGSPNSYPTYDYLGRTFFFGGTVKF